MEARQYVMQFADGSLTVGTVDALRSAHKHQDGEFPVATYAVVEGALRRVRWLSRQSAFNEDGYAVVTVVIHPVGPGPLLDEFTYVEDGAA